MVGESSHFDANQASNMSEFKIVNHESGKMQHHGLDH